MADYQHWESRPAWGGSLRFSTILSFLRNSFLAPSGRQYGMITDFKLLQKLKQSFFIESIPSGKVTDVIELHTLNAPFPIYCTSTGIKTQQGLCNH